MFLPVLLIGDFGVAGWVVFAVANCLGAAGTGLALRRRGAAARFRQEHRVATGVFSIVTVAFHAFFLAWVGAEWLTPPWVNVPPRQRGPIISAYLAVAGNHSLFAWLLGGTGYLFALSLSFARFDALIRLAPTVWGISLALVGVALATGPKPHSPGWTGIEASSDLLWLAPAIVFGFALCPSLDLTILRARERTEGRAGDRAFIGGFLLLFPVMITLTLLYAGRILTRWELGVLLTAHLFVQSAFTMGAHLGELRRGTWPARGWARGLALIGPLGACAAPPLLLDRMLNVDAYRVFLGFYALAAPAYVWIAAVPRGRFAGGGAPSRTTLAAWAIATLAACPLLWLGVIERRWWAVAPAVAIPLLTPLALRAVGRPTA